MAAAKNLTYELRRLAEYIDAARFDIRRTNRDPRAVLLAVADRLREMIPLAEEQEEQADCQRIILG